MSKDIQEHIDEIYEEIRREYLPFLYKKPSGGITLLILISMLLVCCLTIGLLVLL